jgi:hypothetical protein
MQDTSLFRIPLFDKKLQHKSERNNFYNAMNVFGDTNWMNVFGNNSLMNFVIKIRNWIFI